LEIPIVESRFDYIGLNSVHGPLSPMPSNLDEINEVRLRVAVKTTSREYANQVRREVTHLWTHGPVGTTAVISPPPPLEIISLWPTLIPRELIIPVVYSLPDGGCWKKYFRMRSRTSGFEPYEV
jgi:hypothetical protein